METLATLATFTWEPWESLLWKFWALYLATWEPLLGNLLGPSGICTWEPWGSSLASLYSELLWEPAQCNFGNFGSLVEPLLGNLAGTSTMGTLETCTRQPLLGNVGNLRLGTSTREPCGHVYFGTFMLEPGKPLLGNR